MPLRVGVVSGSSSCRSCQRPVVWAVSEAGKNIPIDPEPKPTGNLVLLTSMRDGRIYIQARAFDAEQDADLQRYVSHFVTCPDAKRFRRPR